MIPILATDKKFQKKKNHWCYYYPIVEEWVPLKKIHLLLHFLSRRGLQISKNILINNIIILGAQMDKSIVWTLTQNWVYVT
jgi:hypothetical protein